ncbi:class I SAM-dependent methyltransferase [Nostoc sp.]|uniref:class I SAM-dependent methyltransferase n=1 Tax=Nostoc sp. TaxID=1180 RepID=UPI002FF64F77
MKSLIYSNPTFYNITMRLIYGKGFHNRYKSIASLIPENSTVLEACCGDCYLYKHYLLPKNVKYTGLDINRNFISSAKKSGINVIYHNLLSSDYIPETEYIIIQASMYHFLPNDVDFIYKKLFEATKKEIIIVEPIKNFSTSSNWIIKLISRYLANPGTGHATQRFTATTFQEFCYRYSGNLKNLFKIANGREMCAIFHK